MLNNVKGGGGVKCFHVCKTMCSFASLFFYYYYGLTAVFPPLSQ